MAVQSKKRFDINTHWVSEGTKYHGGVEGTFLCTASINDNCTLMTLTVECEKLTIFPTQTYDGEDSDANCYFVTVFLPTRAPVEFIDKVGGSGATLNSWSAVCNEIAQSSFAKSWSQVKPYSVVSVGVFGNFTQYSEGLSVGQSKTFTKELTDADFDEAGNYKNDYMMYLSDRHWNYGLPPVTGTDVDGQVINVGDRLISTKGFSPSFNDFDYFPGKIHKFSDYYPQWMSHNRWYADDNQGHASILKAGSWRDVKNSINPRAKRNHGLIRNGIIWDTQDLIGVDANTRPIGK